MNYLEIARAARERRRPSRGTDATAPAVSKALIEHVLSLSLAEYREQGSIIEIRVPYLDVTLFFVPSEREVPALQRESISRGRIWTTNELLDLLSIGSLTPESVAHVARAKVAINGDVVEIRRREESEGSEVRGTRKAENTRGCEESELSEESQRRAAQ